MKRNEISKCALANATGGFQGTKYNSAGTPISTVGPDFTKARMSPGQSIQGELFPLSSLGTKPAS